MLCMVWVRIFDFPGPEKPTRFWTTIDVIYGCSSEGRFRGSEASLFVFACNDEMAIRLCKKSIEDGIKIPEQMFILGFDGLQRCVEYSEGSIRVYINQIKKLFNDKDIILNIKGIGYKIEF